jgi:hypothetical protein
LTPYQTQLEETMSPIIAQAAHPALDTAARHRAARLAKATNDQIQAALAYLSMIDPEAFEIALTVIGPDADEPEDDEPIPLCRACGAQANRITERIRGVRGGASSRARRLQARLQRLGRRGSRQWIDVLQAVGGGRDPQVVEVVGIPTA